MDFIAIDFETATYATNSACSLGIACVEKLSIINTEYYLIKPPSLLFSKKNVSVNGITPEQVKDQPSFPEIWEKVKHYFDGSCPVFAHNASFDMSVLKQCLNFYDLPLPDFGYFCSIPFSTKICSGSVGKKLEDRAAFFGIPIQNHHNSEDDAVTCAKIVIETVKNSYQKTFKSFCSARSIKLRDFSSLKPIKGIGNPAFDYIDYSHVVVTKSHPISTFKDQVVVITGDFLDFSRRELAQALINFGAIIKDSVTQKTNILVVGMQDNSVVGSDGLSGKQERALSLKEKGVNIRIIESDELYSILKQEGVLLKTTCKEKQHEKS